ncbi:uncharacterized protein LOC120375811 isoform X5 [Mauremys reevesii]|nr:uncharacterized protein LOC120375811 isoform X5 [Mauremys reevesii]
MDVPRPEVHQRGLHPNWRHCFRSEACPDQALDLPRWLACGCETGSGKWKSRRKGQNCTDVGIPAVGRLWMPQSALESCRRSSLYLARLHGMTGRDGSSVFGYLLSYLRHLDFS